jgi:hypothetical protein
MKALAMVNWTSAASAQRHPSAVTHEPLTRGDIYRFVQELRLIIDSECGEVSASMTISASAERKSFLRSPPLIDQP